MSRGYGFLCRYRRDARSLDEDEELWFNDDDDDDDGDTVEKSRIEDDFSDSYGKYMEAKKGYSPCQCWMCSKTFSSVCISKTNFLHSVIAGAANGANGANNNVKAAVIPPASPTVTANSSSASSVKTVTLPATPVMKVIHLWSCKRINVFT